ESSLRAWRKEAGVRGTLQAAHRVAQQRANAVAEGSTHSSAATGAEGPGACLQQLLCRAGGLAAVEEEGAWTELPLSGPEADQARSVEQPPLSAQARLAALPRKPRSAG